MLRRLFGGRRSAQEELGAAPGRAGRAMAEGIVALRRAVELKPDFPKRTTTRRRYRDVGNAEAAARRLPPPAELAPNSPTSTSISLAVCGAARARASRAGLQTRAGAETGLPGGAARARQRAKGAGDWAPGRGFPRA